MNIQAAIEKKCGDITIKGWVYRERGSNKMRFLIIRDRDNIIQCVVKKDSISEDVWLIAENIKVEASVQITGELGADERAPTGVELSVTDLKLIGESIDFPIAQDNSIEHLANNRHLWLRSRKMTAIMRIRHTVFTAFREYFNQNEFLEFHSPIFQATQAEGGSSVFAVKYFDTTTYLAQTWQLYAEAAIFALENIYTIAPSFRAEKSQTSRHVTEYWHAEMEMVWNTFEEVQDHGEGVLKHIVKSVLEKNAQDLGTLERDIEKLKPTIEKAFPRMTYVEALELLNEKFDMGIEWGKDLRTLEEDKLSSLFDTPIIVTEYPAKVKAFYMKEVEGNPDAVQGYDCIAPDGYGEIIGGSQRETDIEVLIKRLKDEGEDPSEYGYYLDTRKYGSVPHGGFGMGLARVVSWICGLDTIKDAIPFPRTPSRITP